MATQTADGERLTANIVGDLILKEGVRLTTITTETGPIIIPGMERYAGVPTVGVPFAQDPTGGVVAMVLRKMMDDLFPALGNGVAVRLMGADDLKVPLIISTTRFDGAAADSAPWTIMPVMRMSKVTRMMMMHLPQISFRLPVEHAEWQENGVATALLANAAVAINNLRTLIVLQGATLVGFDSHRLSENLRIASGAQLASGLYLAAMDGLYTASKAARGMMTRFDQMSRNTSGYPTVIVAARKDASLLERGLESGPGMNYQSVSKEMSEADPLRGGLEARGVVFIGRTFAIAALDAITMTDNGSYETVEQMQALLARNVRTLAVVPVPMIAPVFGVASVNDVKPTVFTVAEMLEQCNWGACPLRGPKDIEWPDSPDTGRYVENGEEVAYNVRIIGEIDAKLTDAMVYDGARSILALGKRGGMTFQRLVEESRRLHNYLAGQTPQVVITVSNTVVDTTMLNIGGRVAGQWANYPAQIVNRDGTAAGIFTNFADVKGPLASNVAVLRSYAGTEGGVGAGFNGEKLTELLSALEAWETFLSDDDCPSLVLVPQTVVTPYAPAGSALYRVINGLNRAVFTNAAVEGATNTSLFEAIGFSKHMRRILSLADGVASLWRDQRSREGVEDLYSFTELGEEDKQISDDDFSVLVWARKTSGKKDMKLSEVTAKIRRNFQAAMAQPAAVGMSVFALFGANRTPNEITEFRSWAHDHPEFGTDSESGRLTYQDPRFEAGVATQQRYRARLPLFVNENATLPTGFIVSDAYGLPKDDQARSEQPWAAAAGRDLATGGPMPAGVATMGPGGVRSGASGGFTWSHDVVRAWKNPYYVSRMSRLLTNATAESVAARIFINYHVPNGAALACMFRRGIYVPVQPIMVRYRMDTVAASGVFMDDGAMLLATDTIHVNTINDGKGQATVRTYSPMRVGLVKENGVNGLYGMMISEADALGHSFVRAATPAQKEEGSYFVACVIRGELSGSGAVALHPEAVDGGAPRHSAMLTFKEWSLGADADQTSANPYAGTHLNEYGNQIDGKPNYAGYGSYFVLGADGMLHFVRGNDACASLSDACSRAIVNGTRFRSYDDPENRPFPVT
jgi:hypothetical protein